MSAVRARHCPPFPSAIPIRLTHLPHVARCGAGMCCPTGACLRLSTPHVAHRVSEHRPSESRRCEGSADTQREASAAGFRKAGAAGSEAKACLRRVGRTGPHPTKHSAIHQARALSLGEGAAMPSSPFAHGSAYASRNDGRRSARMHGRVLRGAEASACTLIPIPLRLIEVQTRAAIRARRLTMGSPSYSSATIREAWERAGKQRWDTQTHGRCRGL